MIAYSPKTREALDRFYQFRNDIDIYTEDQVADKEFYKSLFKKLLTNDISINDIIPLGGKSTVLKKYEEYLLSEKKRKKLFIIDGDLDLILDTNPEVDNYLYVHPVYCVENYLVNDLAVVELIYYNCGEKSREQITAELAFTTWTTKFGGQLVELFITFAVLKKLKGGPVLKNIQAFLKWTGNSPTLDEEKITAYILENKAKSIELLSADGKGEAEYQMLFNSLALKWPVTVQTILSIISGKDYLLPLMQFKINEFVGKQSLFPAKSIKLFLVNHCSTDLLIGLKDFLNRNN